MPANSKCAAKKCPHDTVCNPPTGRCVAANGAIGSNLNMMAAHQANIDLISMEKIPPTHRIVVDRMPYDVTSLADLVHAATVPDPVYGVHPARLPHNRRVITPAEAAAWTARARVLGWKPEVRAVAVANANRVVPVQFRAAAQTAAAAAAELLRRQEAAAAGNREHLERQQRDDQAASGLYEAWEASDGALFVSVMQEYGAERVARVQNADGRYPLHMVCNMSTDYNTVSWVFRQYPHAAALTDHSSMTPLHVYAEMTDGIDPRVVGMLLREAPAAARVVSHDGLPLHILVEPDKVLDSNYVTVAQRLLRAFPGAVDVLVDGLKKPLDVLERNYLQPTWEYAGQTADEAARRARSRPTAFQLRAMLSPARPSGVSRPPPGSRRWR